MFCFSQGNVQNVYLQYFDKCKIRNYLLQAYRVHDEGRAGLQQRDDGVRAPRGRGLAQPLREVRVPAGERRLGHGHPTCHMSRVTCHEAATSHVSRHAAPPPQTPGF